MQLRSSGLSVSTSTHPASRPRREAILSLKGDFSIFAVISLPLINSGALYMMSLLRSTPPSICPSIHRPSVHLPIPLPGPCKTPFPGLPEPLPATAVKGCFQMLTRPLCPVFPPGGSGPFLPPSLGSSPRPSPAPLPLPRFPIPGVHSGSAPHRPGSLLSS